MLKSAKIEQDPALWFALDRLLTDYFKADIKIVQLDRTKVLNWVNSNIYPIVVANGGRFNISDNEFQSCSINDFQSVLQHDIVKYIKYITDYFDCENFALLFQQRLAQIYNINSCATIVTKHTENSEIVRHEWNVFLDAECQGWGIEPKVAQCWNLNKPVISPVYQLSQADNFDL